MMTQSGCFGSQKLADPIDDIDEARQAVADILDTAAPTVEQPAEAAPNLALSKLLGQYVRRVQLLTWAVIIIAADLVLKEM